MKDRGIKGRKALRIQMRDREKNGGKEKLKDLNGERIEE